MSTLQRVGNFRQSSQAVVEVVGGLSASHCYSSDLPDQTGGGSRLGSQFLFDNFKPFLTKSLTKIFTRQQQSQ